MPGGCSTGHSYQNYVSGRSRPQKQSSFRVRNRIYTDGRSGARPRRASKRKARSSDEGQLWARRARAVFELRRAIAHNAAGTAPGLRAQMRKTDIYLPEMRHGRQPQCLDAGRRQIGFALLRMTRSREPLQRVRVMSAGRLRGASPSHGTPQGMHRACQDVPGPGCKGQTLVAEGGTARIGGHLENSSPSNMKGCCKAKKRWWKWPGLLRRSLSDGLT